MFAHSWFSLKYGIPSPEELLDWASAGGYPQLVLCDINASTGVLSFVRQAKINQFPVAVGIDCRNGNEPHFVILARNNEGYARANHFVSEHIHSETAYPNRAPYLADCYIIYPMHRTPENLRTDEWIGVNHTQLNKLALQEQLYPKEKLLAMNLMTFRNKKDFNTHRLLRAIHHNTLLSKLGTDEQAPMSEQWFDYEQWKLNYLNWEFLYENTEKLLQNCTIEFDFGDDARPQNKAAFTENKERDLILLRQLINSSVRFRYPKLTSEIRNRIEKEIEIIAEKEYLSYFLIAWDIITFARTRRFFYVGRGSGANSIVAFILGITDVDPLELDLYFERFINLYRKNPPDFDLDFSWKDRDEIIHYIFNRYQHAALLCTYSTFQYRAAIREISKVFGLPKTEIDALCKGKGKIDTPDELTRLILRYSKYISNMPSHLSIHAGGIVISEKPMHWFAATFMPPKGFPTTQFSMLEAEDVGLFKFDILSQRGLSKIHECLEIVAYNQPYNPARDIHDIAFFKRDEKIKSLLRNAKAMGCFYVESPAMRMLMVKLQVDTYLGLVAASSIIRPGVAQSGMMREYILRHRYPEKRQEAHPLMMEIMPETYGVMVYQEDVIKVAHHFAGLSLAEADVLRRGMSGKFRSRDEFSRVRHTFFENCRSKGYSEKLSSDIWFQIESFAGYAFSKGHSASYAVESYQSLYLKAHYPLEYMCATINNFGGYYRTEIYVHEARKLGALIEAPSINEGSFECIMRGKTLYLGFMLVNSIERQVIRDIFEEREQRGLFTSFENLLHRVYIPLEQLALIIRIGGLRDFGESRKTLLWKAYFYHSSLKNRQAESMLFEDPLKPITLPVLDEQELELAFEQLELLGFPLCNPFDLLAEPTQPHFMSWQLQQNIGKQINTYGYLIALKYSKTSKGETMYFGTFFDQNGDLIDTVHFPEQASRYPFIGRGIYYLEGRVTNEFEYLVLEVSRMSKCAYLEDVRFSDAYLI